MHYQLVNALIYLRYLFYLNFLVYHRNLSFFTKTATSSLVAKFAFFDFAVKFSAVNLLNSGVVIYLLWSGILFATAVRAVLVAR